MSQEQNAVLTVGLTGGIASGKSTVARWLGELGCTVADADRLVSELYRPGREGALAVRRLFGEEVLDERGAVDHEKLGDIVFANAEARRRLEAEIHPLVGRAFQRLVESSQGIVVFEATLLVETGGADRFDVLVTVEADPELRLRRAAARGTELESARARLRAQASSEQRRARADYVIENEGSLEDLRRQVEALYETLRQRLRQSPPTAPTRA